MINSNILIKYENMEIIQNDKVLGALSLPYLVVPSYFFSDTYGSAQSFLNQLEGQKKDIIDYIAKFKECNQETSPFVYYIQDSKIIFHPVLKKGMESKIIPKEYINSLWSMGQFIANYQHLKKEINPLESLIIDKEEDNTKLNKMFLDISKPADEEFTDEVVSRLKMEHNKPKVLDIKKFQDFPNEKTRFFGYKPLIIN